MTLTHLGLLGGEELAAVQVDQLEGAAAAAGDAGQGILGDLDVQAGLLRQQLVEVAQQRAAAGQDDAALGDVGTELRRGLLERRLDRRDDARLPRTYRAVHAESDEGG